MLNLDFVLGGDEQLKNFVGLAQGGSPLAQSFGHPGLVAGVGVDYIPFALISAFIADHHMAGDGLSAQAFFGDCSLIVHLIMSLSKLVKAKSSPPT